MQSIGVSWVKRRIAVALIVLMICVSNFLGCSSGTSSANSTPPSTQPAPSLTSLSQTSINVGTAAFSLTVTGQNFLSSSVVEWNNAPLSTTFNSPTQLVASVPAANLAIVGAAQIAVSDPSQSLISNALSFAVLQPAPVLTALSVASVTAGSASFPLSVTGQNFLSSSVVQLNGASLVTVVNSPTQLVATVPSANLTSAGSLSITVVDPSPLSLLSNVLTLTVNPVPPVITAISPSSAAVSTGPVSIVILGQNFASGVTVSFGSTPLTVTSQTTNQIHALISASLLVETGTFPITVSNPAPNAVTSTPISFSVSPGPVAIITSITPDSLIAGATATSLQVTGQAFVSGATIQLNGAAIPTFYMSGTQLSAALPDSLIATAGTIAVTVLSPVAGSTPVTSNSANLTISSLPPGDFIVAQTTNDIVWDPQHKLIYASVPSTAAQNPNSIVAIDPTTGLITKSVSAGSEPDLLAISDDGQFLYVALDGSSSVQRFILPAMTPDILVPLGSNTLYGPNIAFALDVAPGSAHTWAVSIGNMTSTLLALEGVTVFDDGVARPASVGSDGTPHLGVLLGTVVWGADATVIYGANNESTGYDFYVLPVNSGGISNASIVDYPNVVKALQERIHFDRTTGYVYTDNGIVLSPSTGKSVGTFSIDGAMAPDGSIGKAFFVTSSYSQNNPPFGAITSYDINHFTPIDSILFPNVFGFSDHLIRWGNNGLAFGANYTTFSGTTANVIGRVYIYSGSLVQ